MSIWSNLVLQLTLSRKSKEHVVNEQWSGQCQKVSNFLIRPCGETDCSVLGRTYATRFTYFSVITSCVLFCRSIAQSAKLS